MKDTAWSAGSWARASRFFLMAWGWIWFSLRSLSEPVLLARLESLPQVCPVRAFFGLKCAFCGMTHAFIRFLFFDFEGAQRENALAVPLFAGSILLAALFSLSPRAIGFAQRHLRAGVWLGLLVLLVYAVVRNQGPA